jgi:D-alanine-D-alanine ligase
MTRQVLILYGGRSSEHEISCLSARSVLGAIDRNRYDVFPVGITREGRWVLTDGVIEPRPGRPLPEVNADGPTVGLIRGRSGPMLVAFDRDGDGHTVLAAIDAGFPVLHGPYGEDGTVQGLLASVDVPYVGADVTASSIGIDKRAAKNTFKARGLPQVAYLPVRRERWEAELGEVLDEIEGALSYPVFVKPARQGSSIGITKARDRDGLEAGLKEAYEYDRVAIVEDAVEDAREIEVGVLGNSEVEVTAPGEVVPSHEFYDFEAKYLDESELLVPADLGEETIQQVRELARQAYLAIGCRGMARIDFFVRGGSDGQSEVLVNEINTIPGFTPNSMFPRLWEAEGLDYPALVDRLFDLALDASRVEAHYAP